jgi:hypothetical protein
MPPETAAENLAETTIVIAHLRGRTDMPNHVKTVVQLAGPASAIDRFIRTHIKTIDDELELDFETVVPMPECLKDTEADWGIGRCFFALGVQKNTARQFPLDDRFEKWFADRGAITRPEMLAWLELNEPQKLAEAKRQVLAQAETGYPDWYQWSIVRWGTKWSSYWFDWTSEEPVAFSFFTAWSFPHPIFATLAVLYPDLTFDCSYVDEGREFDGRSVYRDGRFDESASWYRRPAGEDTDHDCPGNPGADNVFNLRPK